MSLGPTELVLILVALVASVVPLALGIWAIVDTTKYPDHVWAAAGKDKGLWLALNIIGLLVCLVLPIVYLVSVRPSLRRAAGMA